MSPDIDWQVGEDADQETIVHISRRPTRWRKPIVLLVIVIGLGLGLLYTSLPEPAHPIATPTPIVTPSPVPELAFTIDREARALATGDRQTFGSLLDPDEVKWRQDQLEAFRAWDTSPHGTKLYRIIATAQLDAQHAWADVIQARAGKYFRETRWYRLRQGVWVRTPPTPDLSAWSNTATITTHYFQMTYATIDADQARLFSTYLDQQARETCQTFDCNFTEQRPTVHFILQPDQLLNQPRVQRSPTTFTVTLSSPRITGYYSADFTGAQVDDDQWAQSYDRYLYFPLLYATIGGAQRWDQKRDGLMYLYAVGFWDLNRRGRTGLKSWQFPFRPDLVADLLALPADQLWDWPADTSQRGVQIRLANASALIQFIDETYGTDRVVRFFQTLRFAQSLTQAIQLTDIPYDEFAAKWITWSSRHELNPWGQSN